MAKKKKIKRKELLKEPDEFLTFSSRLFSWVTTHQRQLAYAGVVVVGLFALYIGGYLYYRHINKVAQSKYNDAYQALAAGMKPDANPKTWEKTEKLFMQVITKYSLSRVSRLAFPQAAYAAYRKGHYGEAIKLYKRFLSKVSNETNYQILTQMALASCYEEKKDYARAVQLLEPISQEKANPFREFAMMSLARVYRLAKKDKESKRILKQFTEEFPDSPFLPMAKALLGATRL